MTVCIAAICRWNQGFIIVGAADRLVTYSDIEYEQPSPKIFDLASHTVVMISGSLEDHTEILNRTRRSLIGQPGLSTATIAGAYAQQFALYRREIAARKYLEPRGLSLWTFLNNQTGLSPSVARDLGELMEDEKLGSSAIVAGVDGLTAHIYVIADPGQAICHDGAGWASIGAGWHHADAHFISEKYSIGSPYEDAILLAYLAKKKADVTPGVGSYTDLFWIAGEGMRLLGPSDDIVRTIEKVHRNIEKSETRIRATSKQTIHNFVRIELEKQAQQQIAAQQPAPEYTAAETLGIEPPTIEGGLREGSPQGQPEA